LTNKKIGQEAPGWWAETFWPVPDDPKSAESLSFVKGCLKQCLAEHSQDTCAIPPVSHIFPERVLDLSACSMKLIEYREELGPYIALSHCWGDAVPLQLTSKSSKSFQNIDFDLLPNTFRDAVTLTKYLGFNYLWIDSLCVYQDDKTDWEIESSKMGDVYQNAILTIAASSSKSSDVSFLSARSRPERPYVNVVFKDQKQKAYNLMATRVTDYHKLDDPEFGPIHERAWCFQEYHLSKRVVSYNNDEIWFKCRSKTRCQRQKHKSYDLRGPSQVIFQLQNFSDDLKLKNWLHIVSSYLERKLSFSSDRLAALSGIALLFQKATGWTYIAGVWSEMILACLCWSSFKDSPLPGVSNIDIAPTFSWASLTGQAFYLYPAMVYEDHPTTVVHTVFIRHSFIVVGQNPFDRVAPGAFIELEGPLLEVGIESKADRSECWAVYDECKWKFYPDTPLGVAAIGNQNVAARCSDWDSADRLNDSVVWILFLATTDLYMGGQLKVDAIVLRKLQNDSDGFERVGLMTDYTYDIRDASRERQAKKIISTWVQEAVKSRLKIY
jgi:hypothetical protein